MEEIVNDEIQETKAATDPGRLDHRREEVKQYGFHNESIW